MTADPSLESKAGLILVSKEEFYINNMNLYKFETNLLKLDERSIFANLICKLIYDKYNGDLDEAIKEAEDYFNYLDMFVKNIYEVIEYEIPLYAYYNLVTNTPKNWNWTDDQYNQNILLTKQACKEYYGNH